MKNIITLAFLILIQSICLAQPHSSLVVLVSDKETGKAIPGASVIIKEAGWATKTADGNGKAIFTKSIPMGEIHFVVSKEECRLPHSCTQ